MPPLGKSKVRDVLYLLRAWLLEIIGDLSLIRAHHATRAKNRTVLVSPAFPLAIVAFLGLFALAGWLRHLNFTAEFLLFSYLQTVGSLLSFTYAANAFVRFRGTHDRLTLMLALGFVLAGVVETLAVLSFYGQLSAGAALARIPMSWMVGRTLLAILLLAALVVERRVPQSREPGREIAIAIFVVGVVAYVTSAVYFAALIEPAIHPTALIARPWDLFPAFLFLLAALGFGRRLRSVSSPFDRALVAALWISVACHVVVVRIDAHFRRALHAGAGAEGGQLRDRARRRAAGQRAPVRSGARAGGPRLADRPG